MSESEPTAAVEPKKAVSMAKRALERCTEIEADNQELRSENRELRDEVDKLRQRVRDLEDRDDLADTVSDASRLKVEERAGHCIRTLYRQASQNGGRASMDYKGADAALGGGLDRRQLLDALERAADLADTTGVRFKKEERSSQRNSRLILNTDEAELPSRMAGVEITGGR